MNVETLKSHLTPRNVFFALLGLIVIPLFFAIVYTAMVVSEGLPPIEQLENPKPELATQIISADGELLGQFYIKQRRYMPFDSIPKDFTNALIATEDREFYNHWGIHMMRVFKAAIKNILAFRTREGASTITQQLARNLFLTHEKRLSRKIKEAFTALELERTHTKNEILELYTNTINFGRSAYGLQMAAQAYFDKTPQQLTTAECAYLVGIAQRPARYEKDFSAAMNRRNVVLQCMRDEGYISEAQYKASRASVTTPVITDDLVQTQTQNLAPHFVEMIRQKFRDEAALKEFNLRGYDLYRDGLIITTTLNARMQQYANDAVREHLEEFQREFERFWRWDRNDKKKRSGDNTATSEPHEALLNELLEKAAKSKPAYLAANDPAERRRVLNALKNDPTFVEQIKKEAIRIQTGFVALEHASGEIRAMVGSSTLGKENRYSLNHVTQIRRQPGSAFKPFVYASALATGLSPYSRVPSTYFSAPMPNGKIWSLAGREGDEEGMMTLAEALRLSVNTVAARLITEHTSPSAVIQAVRKAGIKSDLDAVASLALGSEEVSPMELTAAYAVFPNQGVYVEPYFITRIEDRFGNVIYDRSRVTPKVTDVYKSKVAREMVGMMRNVVNSGTAARARRWFSYEAAGKTGTTNDFTDAWFVGFTPQLTAGVWVGFDDQRIKFTGRYGEGGSAAVPIWARFMAKVYRDPLLRYKSSQRFGTDVAIDVGTTLQDLNNPPEEHPEVPPPMVVPDTSKQVQEH
jgi:penicillin-binding protein 1A